MQNFGCIALCIQFAYKTDTHSCFKSNSRDFYFEQLWIYCRLSDDKENTFAVLF